jgi:RHS repeat-associated protein
VVTDSTGAIIETADYYPYGSIRLDTGSFKEQRKYIGQEYDNETSLSYLNARYYDGNRGQFISQDPVFLNPEGQGKEIFTAFLTDPQTQNSYSYARDNPITLKDPDGKWTKGQVEGVNYLYDNSPAWRYAMDNPVKTGAIIGVGAGLGFVAGASVATTLSANYLGGIGLGCAINCPTVAKGLQLGEKFGKYGKVVENTGQRITSYGEIHGPEKIVERGLTKTLMQITTNNPLVTLAQDGGNRNLYLTQKAAVVLDKVGQVITTYSQKYFNTEVKSIISKALGH